MKRVMMREHSARKTGMTAKMRMKRRMEKAKRVRVHALDSASTHHILSIVAHQSQ